MTLPDNKTGLTGYDKSPDYGVNISTRSDRVGKLIFGLAVLAVLVGLPLMVIVGAK